MREAVGQAFVYNIVIIIVTLMIAVLVVAMAYSRTYKVKMRVVDIIEKYKGYTPEAKGEIEQNLKSIGYRMNTNATQTCKAPGGNTGTSLTDTSTNYHYCVFRYDTNKGTYYGVTVYMYFDFPIFGNLLEFPIYGETEIFYGMKG